MESYTFGTDEFMAALHRAMLKTGENYPITLNYTDFRVLTSILRDLAMYGEATRSMRLAVLNIMLNGTDDVEPVEEWAWGWLSAIADTLGVEGI